MKEKTNKSFLEVYKLTQGWKKSKECNVFSHIVTLSLMIKSLNKKKR